MRLRPNDPPRAVFPGEFSTDPVGAIVVLQPHDKITRLADVKTAIWVLKNIRPKHGAKRELAPKVGLEPIVASFLMYSLLLIIAFLCANLPAKIRAFPSCCKLYFASLCNNRQKNLCGTVRLCGNCAVVKCCAVTVRGLLPGQHCKRAVAGHCERLAGLMAGLGAGCGSPARAGWPGIRK